MKLQLIFFSIVLVAFVACSQPEELIEDQSMVVGNWVNQQVNDTIYTFQRAKSLIENDYCFSINADGRFIERKNSGFCGTPPISYADFEGTWTLQDSIITISVPYWGGNSMYNWKIISVDGTQISFIWVDRNYENLD